MLNVARLSQIRYYLLYLCVFFKFSSQMSIKKLLVIDQLEASKVIRELRLLTG